MTNIRKPSVGSISEGTMRVADLLGSFAWELKHISDKPEHVTLAEEAETREETLIGADQPDETDKDHECLAALFDALDELAPPYCYFGANEGDGASYGFWPSMDAIDELPRIKNEEGEDLPDEDHAYVNDHGNVTVYNAAHEIILELV